MKSKRIPFDIEYLMESILSESPDRFSIDSQDAEKFKKLGINQKAGTVYWYDEEAYPFFIEPKDKIVIYRRGETHGNMETTLGFSARKTASEASFSFAYDFSSINGDVGFVSKVSSRSKCYFHGLEGNDLNAVREYIAKHAEYFEKLEIRGGKQGVEALEIAGRLWKEKNVISFWNDKDEVMPFMKEIFSFMKNLGLDIHKSLYEFIDSRGFYTHYELTGQLPDTKEKMSAAEKQEMLAQKHLKKDKQEFGSQFWAQHGKKAAKGFDIPAKASAAMPAREATIKLKDLIKQNGK